MSKPVALAKDVLTADLASRIEQVFGKSTDSLDLVERRARELLPEHKVVIWEGDPQTFQFGFVSQAAEDILGYPCGRWVTEPDFWVSTVVHPDHRHEAAAFCALATGQGRDHDFQYLAVRADGGSTLIHDVVKVIKGPRGIAARLRGIMIEIGDN
ncbi:MAG: PAS domain-containing protein [Acidobacteriota bacterium]|nr:PAS domain-containing protein [Acidobacteriota bacterium]